MGSFLLIWYFFLEISLPASPVPITVWVGCFRKRPSHSAHLGSFLLSWILGSLALAFIFIFYFFAPDYVSILQSHSSGSFPCIQLPMVPRNSHFLKSMPVCSPHPQWVRADMSGRLNTVRMTVCDFWSQVQKGAHPRSLLDHSRALWKSAAVSKGKM